MVKRNTTPDELKLEEQQCLLRGTQIWLKYRIFVEEDESLRSIMFSAYKSIALALLSFEELGYTLTAPKYSDHELTK